MGLKDKVDAIISRWGLTTQPPGTTRLECVPDSEHIDNSAHLSNLLGMHGITPADFVQTVNQEGIPSELSKKRGLIPEPDRHAYDLVTGYCVQHGYTVEGEKVRPRNAKEVLEVALAKEGKKPVEVGSIDSSEKLRGILGEIEVHPLNFANRLNEYGFQRIVLAARNGALVDGDNPLYKIVNDMLLKESIGADHEGRYKSVGL